jgi:hypothetical protein
MKKKIMLTVLKNLFFFSKTQKNGSKFNFLCTSLMENLEKHKQKQKQQGNTAINDSNCSQQAFITKIVTRASSRPLSSRAESYIDSASDGIDDIPL